VTFLRETLDNGLEIIAEQSPAALSTSVGFFVGTGSRDETDDLWGTSHFLEHMVFKGTDRLTAADINRRFDALGASFNAFTSEEDTVYYASVLPEHQREAVELLSEMMRPALREEDFTTEKLVILEEIRMYDDQPPFGADDRCRAAFFRGHPLARSVLGSVDSITSLPVERMRDYHRRRYSPPGMVLAASGAVDFDDLVRTARRCCGAWETLAMPPREVPFEPSSQRGQLLPVERPTASLAYAVRMVPGPDGRDPDRFAAKLLSVVLGDDSGSRLYWALVDTGLAEHAVLHHADFLEAGIFAIQLSCDPGEATELLERLDDLLDTWPARGVTPAELEQARNKLAGRIVLSGERPRRRLFTLGLEWVHNRSYRSVSDGLGIVARLSLADLERVARRWPLPRRGCTVLAGPLSGSQGD